MTRAQRRRPRSMAPRQLGRHRPRLYGLEERNPPDSLLALLGWALVGPALALFDQDLPSCQAAPQDPPEGGSPPGDDPVDRGTEAGQQPAPAQGPGPATGDRARARGDVPSGPVSGTPAESALVTTAAGFDSPTFVFVASMTPSATASPLATSAQPITSLRPRNPAFEAPSLAALRPVIGGDDAMLEAVAASSATGPSGAAFGGVSAGGPTASAFTTSDTEFAGTAVSPPGLSAAQGNLSLDSDPSINRVFRWQSYDSVHGPIDTGTVTVSSANWHFTPPTPSSPAQLNFTYKDIGQGVSFAANILFEAYDRAVVDVTRLARRVRYLLVPPKVEIQRMAPAPAVGFEPAGDWLPLYRPTPLIRIPNFTNADFTDKKTFTPPAGSESQAFDPISYVTKLEVSIDGGALADIARVPGAAPAAGDPYPSTFTYTFTNLDTLQDSDLGTRRRYVFKATSYLGRVAFDELTLETRINPTDGKRFLEAIHLDAKDGGADPPPAGVADPARDALRIPPEARHKLAIKPIIAGAATNVVTVSPNINLNVGGAAQSKNMMTVGEVQATEFVLVDDSKKDPGAALPANVFPHFLRNVADTINPAANALLTATYRPLPLIPAIAVSAQAKAAYFDLAAFASHDDTEATNPVTVRLNDLNSGAIAQDKLLMLPLKIDGRPDMSDGDVILEYASGGPADVQVWEPTADGKSFQQATLPKTIPAAMFTGAQATMRFLVEGRQITPLGATDPQLRVRWEYRGKTISTDLVKYRVRKLPGLAGEAIAGFPHLNYASTFNVDNPENNGDQISVSIDPFFWSQLTRNQLAPAGGGLGATYNIVAHQTPAQWAANPALVPVATDLLALRGHSILNNRRTVWVAPTVGDYDVVIDLANANGDPGPDGMLNPGDIIGKLTVNASDAEVHVLADPGTQSLYAHSAFVDYQFPDYWATGGGDDVQVRLRGRVQYPITAAAAAAAPRATTPNAQGIGDGEVTGGAGGILVAASAAPQYWSGIYIGPDVGAAGLGTWNFSGSVTKSWTSAPETAGVPNTWIVNVPGQLSFGITQGTIPFQTGDRIFFNVTRSIAPGSFPVVVVAHGNHLPYRVSQPKLFDTLPATNDFDARFDEDLKVFNTAANPGTRIVRLIRQAAGNWRIKINDTEIPGAAGLFNDNTRKMVTTAAGTPLFDAYISPTGAYRAGDTFILVTNDTDPAQTPDENYRGYGINSNGVATEYLLEHLARNGFVAVSIALDDLETQQLYPTLPAAFGGPLGTWNGTTAGITERANIINQHVLRLVGNANVATTGASQGVLDRLGLVGLDFANTTIIGHSRGGEAVARAANREAADGTVNGAATYRAVVSIAPTSELPTAQTVVNLPFLGIYGSHDGDVSWGGAFQIYDQATTEKQLVFLRQANHNYFNRSWGANDDGKAANDFNGVAADPAAARLAHETVATSYILAMLESRFTRTNPAGGNIAPNPAYKDYFRRDTARFRPPALRATWGFNEYLNPNAAFVNVDNFSTNNAAGRPNQLGRAITRSRFEAKPLVGGATPGRYNLTLRDNVQAFSGAAVFTDPQPVPTPVADEVMATGAIETIATEDGRYHGSTFADELTWNTPPPGPGVPPRAAVYDTALGAINVAQLAAVTFRAAQRHGAAGNVSDLNITLQLIDNKGNQSTIEAARLATINTPIARADEWGKANFVTVRIPLLDFNIDGRAVNLASAQTIRLVFDRRERGTVAIDDIAFESNA